jgi:hypothetical protein
MEHVTTVAVMEGDESPALDRAIVAYTARLGRDGEVRGSLRDAGLMFQWMRAAKARFRIAEVKRHECRHDEGIGDCTDAVAVVG